MPDSINRINEYNKAPISLREGHVFLDGLEIMDCVKCRIVYKPEIWEGGQLNERSKSRRQLGYDITGSITERRATSWLKDLIKKYQQTGRTPEFTIQGVMNDENSDYYATNGSDVVTAVGCVLTGETVLTDLDREGQILNEEVQFAAYDVIL